MVVIKVPIGTLSFIHKTQNVETNVENEKKKNIYNNAYVVLHYLKIYNIYQKF